MIRERNGKFEVIVYVGRTASGKRRSVSRTEPTLRKAQARERQLLREQTATRAADGSDATLGHLIDRWLDFARVEESTRYNSRLQLDRHVRPVLGDVKVSKLRAEDLDDLYRTLERGKPPLAASTVRRLHAMIRSVLELAVRWGWIAQNPAERADPPGVGRHEPAAPSTEAVVALVDHLTEDEPELALFVWLAAVTGMRRAEVCALRRADLDLDAGVVRKVGALGTAKGAPYLKTTKTGIRHTLAIDGTTVDLLRWHLKVQDATADEYGAVAGGEAFVFSHDVDGGRPWRPDFVSKRIRTLRAGVPGAERLTLRDLRHWMATEGFESGASAKAVQGRGGWARAATPLDHYAASVPPADRVLADHLAVRLAEARGALDDAGHGPGRPRTGRR